MMNPAAEAKVRASLQEEKRASFHEECPIGPGAANAEDWATCLQAASCPRASCPRLRRVPRLRKGTLLDMAKTTTGPLPAQPMAVVAGPSPRGPDTGWVGPCLSSNGYGEQMHDDTQ